MKRFLLTPFIVFLFVVSAMAQQNAFPGAEGAGRFTTGGRGTPATATTVYEVTRLDDPIPAVVGTFRYATTSNSTVLYRTVIFRVSGTIRLTNTLSLNRPNTTIAGQTAPGDGICIADYPVSISADNIIVRFIRFRLGDRYQQARLGSDDAFSGTGRKLIVIDHCTMSWSNDECFTIYAGDSTTAQWNILSEPLDRSYHDEGSGIQNHGYGGIWGGRRSTFHHNLIAHVRGRAPRFDGSRNLPNSTAPQIGLENVDFKNNVIYNWVDYNVNGGEGGNYNVVSNYYKYGPSTLINSTAEVGRRNMIINPYKQASPALPYGKYYLIGNYVDSLQGIPSFVTYRNWRGAAMNGGNLNDTIQSKVETPFNIAPVIVEDAQQAYLSVLNNAGAILPKRDTLDERIVNDVRNRTGRIIDVQGGYAQGTPFSTSQNAWPALNSLPAPTDTDRDGMPDEWESANGLNPNDPADRNVYGSDGYTMLEKYLNNIVAVALPLQLVSFKAVLSGKQVIANWTTVNEINTQSFTIERSANGTHYQAIRTLPAHNVLQPSNYTFTDNQPLPGRSFYRLKMMDKDGSSKLSNIVTIMHFNEVLLSISPNPASHNVIFTHPVAIARSQVNVVGSDGSIIMQQQITTGSTREKLDISALPYGSYFIHYINNNQILSIPFLKQ